MTYLCGIYGYQITRKIEIDGFKIVPLTENWGKAKLLARDEHSYNLTAVLVGEESPSDNFLFNLEAILAFIEHLDVLITGSPVESTGEDIFLQFNQKIVHHRKNGGGAVIGEDTFFENSRNIFIQKAMNKLQDRSFCEETKFNVLFFKCVEAFKSTYLDVQYFLLFSGLETFVREKTNDKDTPVSLLASRFLSENYGFNVESNSDCDLKRTFQSYTHVRNALFHNSELQIEKKNSRAEMIAFKLNDYFPHFRLLIQLVILKIVEFDDGYINWDRWIQLQ